MRSIDINVVLDLSLGSYLFNLVYQELSALRDGLIQCLALVQTEISKRPASTAARQPDPLPPLRSSIENASLAASQRISQGTAKPGESDGVTLNQELRTSLGLLLKHRGGPGFGHGRLRGAELDSLEGRLRSLTQKLIQESVEAA